MTPPTPDLNIFQQYWWFPWITTFVLPTVQLLFSRYASSLEMPDGTSTKKERQWFRLCNNLAGNPKRSDALDDLMKTWIRSECVRSDK